MDNLCHTLTGTALAGAGLRRLSPLATAALVLGANIPDLDALVYAVADEYTALAFRRGITHSIPALLLWPFVVTGALLAWDRLARRRRAPAAEAVRAGPLLLVSMIAVLSHPSLDWLNTYGMRWLLPLDGDWSYGDAVFIIDPWLWLSLGAATVLAWRWSWRGALGWGALGLATSALVLTVTGVPAAARVVWSAGVVGLAALALLRRPRTETGRTRAARGLVAAAGLYVVLMVLSSWYAERRVRAVAEAAGVRGVQEVMAGPVPADPFRREVVVVSAEGYRLGSLEGSRVSLAAEPIPRRPAGVPEAVVRAALATEAARDYLVWSRFPFVTASRAGDGWRVRLSDARYGEGGGLSGPAVFVGSDGRAREE